jgi:hypothetical protein
LSLLRNNLLHFVIGIGVLYPQQFKNGVHTLQDECNGVRLFRIIFP